MKIVSFIIFLSIAIAIFFGLYYFVYYNIVKGLMLSNPFKSYFRIFFILLSLLFIISEILKRTLPVYLISWLGAVWLGIICIGFSVFIIQDIIQIFLPHQRKLLTLISLILIIIASAYSVYNVSCSPRLKEIKLKLQKWPAKLKGFTMVQLSDTHLGILNDRKWTLKLVQQVNTLNPDLIVITGDLLDENICDFEHYCSLLKELKSRYGVYAITGNHEYYVGVEHFIKLAKASGINVLQNQKVTIACTIELIGVNDKDAKRVNAPLPDIEHPLSQCDKTKPIILLNHRPDAKDFESAADKGVDLQLSGHIHAGQLPPVDLLVYLFIKYYYGLFAYHSSYVYTTSGTGTWGPPMRLFSHSEIVKFIFE